MFFRVKKSGPRAYLQIVENHRLGGTVRQSVIANLGRAEALIASGALAALLASGAKLTDQVLLLQALDQDDGSLALDAKRIGGPLLFARLWQELRIGEVLDRLLQRAISGLPPSVPCLWRPCTGCLSRAPTGTACRGWPTMTSVARRLCACIIFTARWRGSARPSRRFPGLRPHRVASR